VPDNISEPLAHHFAISCKVFSRVCLTNFTIVLKNVLGREIPW